MPDIYSKEKRSQVMSKIRSSNTKPELIVRRFLFSQGFRFRLHQKNLPGKPDIVLKRYNAIILVNGCFWHGHKKCKDFQMPKSRVNYWKPKIHNNIGKDINTTKKLKKLGWNVIVVWECKLEKSKLQKSLNMIASKILQTS